MLYCTLAHCVESLSLLPSPICSGNKHIVVLFIVLWMKAVGLVHNPLQEMEANFPKAETTSKSKSSPSVFNFSRSIIQLTTISIQHFQYSAVHTSCMFISEMPQCKASV